MTATPKIAAEVAEAEFERMCGKHRVELDTSEMGEAELAQWTDLRKAIVRDLQSGVLIVGADGNPTYTPPGGKAITFHGATGATVTALETLSKDKQAGNLNCALAQMTRMDRIEFEKIHALDWQACSRLAKLFLP